MKKYFKWGRAIVVAPRELRQDVLRLAAKIERLVPESREKDVVFAQLETAMFLANEAIEYR